MFTVLSATVRSSVMHTYYITGCEAMLLNSAPAVNSKDVVKSHRGKSKSRSSFSKSESKSTDSEIVKSIGRN